MHLTRLALTDFRSYTSVDLELEAGVTAFIGPNGTGKTNLVEAVGYLATLGSHRVSVDGPLIRLGAERAVIRAVVERDGRANRLELEITPGKTNRARLNQAQLTRPRDLLGTLRTVLFAPEDLVLVKGDPGDRRRFLDELLVARTPRLASVRQDYDRVLKQRNALLKSAGATIRAGRGDVRTLDVWDSHLAQTGAELIAARLDLIDSLRPLVDKAYEALAHGSGDSTGPTSIEYQSSLERGQAASDAEPLHAAARPTIEAALLAALQEMRSAELERGISLVGPHRDEVLLKLGPLPARGYASHGESWSVALALKLAAYDLLTADGGEPVLILDDVFAELDTGRRERLAALLGEAEQVLVTAAVAADVPEPLSGARVEVTAGDVRAVR